MQESTAQLKAELTGICRRHVGAGLLFSGGLDSGIIAASNPGLKAFTVDFQGRGQDIDHSRRLARQLGLKQTQVRVEREQALAALPELIKMLKTFDPALPNDLAAYFGLAAAKAAGVTVVLTGDGSDELFGGYSFMRGIKDLNVYIRRISADMRFSSNVIAQHLGLRLVQPFLDKKVVELALSIPAVDKIREENGCLHGKWVLRKAFEDVLPAASVWQDKRPLEIGSGMTHLRAMVESLVSEEEFLADLDGIKFINREHRHYYRIYKSFFGRPPKAADGLAACPACAADLGRRLMHCSVCGWAKELNELQ